MIYPAGSQCHTSLLAVVGGYVQAWLLTSSGQKTLRINGDAACRRSGRDHVSDTTSIGYQLGRGNCSVEIHVACS